MVGTNGRRLGDGFRGGTNFFGVGTSICERSVGWNGRRELEGVAEGAGRRACAFFCRGGCPMHWVRRSGSVSGRSALSGLVDPFELVRTVPIDQNGSIRTGPLADLRAHLA